MTRPITDRVKENLFNLIGADIVGCTFLDLFAGIGSVGIEANSRGANFVQFIEKNHQPYNILRENLHLIEDENTFSLQKADALKFIPSYKGSPFDYVFIAPPQYKGLWKRTLALIDGHPKLLVDSGRVIVQIDPVEFEELPLNNFMEIDQRRYGSTLLMFYRLLR